MLASTSLAEKCIERIVTSADSLVAGHLAIGLNAVLETEKFPTRIADLDTTLANVQAESLTHCD